MEHHEVAALWYHDPKAWIAISFGIFMLLFLKFMLPKVTAGLDARAAKISDELDQAEKLRAEAETLLASYKKQQKAMLKQGEELLETAQKEADAIRAKAADELKQTLARRRAQAEESIARAEADAIREMRQQLVDIASGAARKVITERLKDQKADPAITRALAAIEEHIH